MEEEMRKKFSFLRIAILVVATALALPLTGLAQGRGHRRDKNDVFVNGHDARDGRWDGRGPRRDRDRDRDNDNDDRYRNGQNGQYGRNGSYGGYGGYGRNGGYGGNNVYQIAM